MQSFEERAKNCSCFMGRKLLQLCSQKKTNLALSADVTSADALLTLADTLGAQICILKTHIDTIEDFTPQFISELTQLAKHHQFLLFEDRKFADIGNTVKQQYSGGIYHIVDWADIINAHSMPGPGIIQALKSVAIEKNKPCGLLLIAEMSSKGHLLTKDYREQTLKLAEEYPEFVMGFITQHAVIGSGKKSAMHFINMTPGVQLEEGKDNLGQQYITPEKAIIENGADIIIVGRGILGAKDKLTKAREYRERAFQSYEARLKLESRLG